MAEPAPFGAWPWCFIRMKKEAIAGLDLFQSTIKLFLDAEVIIFLTPIYSAGTVFWLLSGFSGDKSYWRLLVFNGTPKLCRV
jgi:hypothetical protein